MVKIISQEMCESIFISANGFISRDLFEVCDKENNFYMIGSMGLASSIGLGVAIKNPNKKICVFDGDGNILMNLGSLVTIGSIKPKNLIHFIFDNGSHESTGGQPTNFKNLNLKKFATSLELIFYEINSPNQIKRTLSQIKKNRGPILVHVKIERGGGKSLRMSIPPKQIKERFMKSLKK